MLKSKPLLVVISMFFLIAFFLIGLHLLSRKYYALGYGYYKKGLFGKVVHKEKQDWWSIKYGSSVTVLDNVHKETFTVLNNETLNNDYFQCNNDYCECSYAKDKNNAYLNGNKIRKVNLNTFKYLGSCLARDKSNVYSVYQEDYLLSQEQQNFEIVNNIYAKDSDYVYYLGYPKNLSGINSNGVLVAADPVSFEHVGADFYKDGANVYFNGEVLEGADTDTFSKLEEESLGNEEDLIEIYKDKNYLFWEDRTLDASLIEDSHVQLKQLGRGYFRSGNSIYYLNLNS